MSRRNLEKKQPLKMLSREKVKSNNPITMATREDMTEVVVVATIEEATEETIEEIMKVEEVTTIDTEIITEAVGNSEKIEDIIKEKIEIVKVKILK
jgi:hypothetical protein